MLHTIVPVMVVGEKQEIQSESEDGDHRGTAGAPILYGKKKRANNWLLS